MIDLCKIIIVNLIKLGYKEMKNQTHSIQNANSWIYIWQYGREKKQKPHNQVNRNDRSYDATL